MNNKENVAAVEAAGGLGGAWQQNPPDLNKKGGNKKITEGVQQPACVQPAEGMQITTLYAAGDVKSLKYMLLQMEMLWFQSKLDRDCRRGPGSERKRRSQYTKRTY
jgi:hypothetical protein